MNLVSRFLEVTYSYSPLPTSMKSNHHHRVLPKRYVRLFLLILTISTIAIFCFLDTRRAHNAYEIYANHTIPLRYPDVPYPKIQLTAPDKRADLPPLYEQYKDYEDRVSEWNLKTYGKETDRYMYISNHAHGSGWGNIMQEMVFCTLLASGSGRGLAWSEYVWNNDGSKYSEFNGKLIPSKIPLSTMIAGHMLGLPKSPGLPPSISKSIYERICPQSDRLYLDDLKVKEHLGLPKDSDDLYWRSPGQDVLDAWISLLNSPAVRDRKCVEITGPQVFTIWILNSPRLHSLVKTLFSSPVITNWGWSELVKGVFRKNIELFVSTRSLLQVFAWRLRSSTTNWLSPQNKLITPGRGSQSAFQSDSSPLPLLVLHLRRGDYEDHCHHLTKYHSEYVGMLTLPEFRERDAFVSPNTTYDETFIPEDVSRFYTKHCYPDPTLIKQRVREVLHDYEKVLDAEDRRKPHRFWRLFWRWRWSGLKPLVMDKVKKVYIMSNGKKEWLEEVKQLLIEDAKQSAYNGEWEFAWSWEDIGNSRELKAGWEEKPILHAMDMYVGQRAELFVGNGFSTLTSNLVMFRKHNGFHPVQTRLW